MADVSIHPTSVERFIDRMHVAFEEGDAAIHAKAFEANHVQCLQEQYRAIASGDFSVALASMAEDIEMELHGPAEIPINGSWRGRDEVSAAVQRNFASLADQEAEILSLIAQGDTLVLYAQERGKVRASGAAYHVRWTQIFTFRDERIVRVHGVYAQIAPPS